MKKRWAALVALAVATTALAVPGTASASTTEAVAGTGGMTLTMGVVGSPLDIAVTLDETGHITSVAVTDGAEFTEDRADEHKVRFFNEDGTTRVDVTARNNKLKADVRAADLATILGEHVWEGNLFGAEDATVVTFEVVDSGGVPELANVAVTFPASLSDATADIRPVENKVEDDETESVVKITFMWNGYTMTMKIKASMESDDDDDLSVKLKIELKGKDVQKLRRVDLGDLVGPHEWGGHLCDATPVGVTYEISADGDFTNIVVTKDGAATDEYEMKNLPHGFRVEFDDSKAKVTFELKEKQPGLWDLKVRSKTTDKCNHGNDDQNKRDRDDDDDDAEERGRRNKDKKKDRDDDDDDDEGDDD